MPHRIAVVGGGISGLTAAYRLRKRLPEAGITVYERAGVAGGKVRTTVRDGYVVEWGPNGFLTNAPEALELATELGLEEELVVASAAAKKRYVFRGGGLRAVPASPPALLRSELLSISGKARAALEPALARRATQAESVHDFVARHFGREVADRFAEVVVLGVSAGDPRMLDVDALFPGMRVLEDKHRSLLLGLIRAQRARASGAGSSSGRLTSFGRGSERLVQALAAAVGDDVRTGTAVRSIGPDDGGGVRIVLDGAPDDRADAVILAVPAYAAAELLDAWKPEAARRLRTIEFAPVRVVGVGFDRVDVPRHLDGFGFLVPSGEGVRSLGVLWSSTVFPDHAPSGRVLLRILAGGVRDPEIVDLDPDEAVAAVLRDLRLTMGITAPPRFVEQVSWPSAIPQYGVGHRSLVATIEQELAGVEPNGPQIRLTGNSYRGIGLNDCIRDATRVAHGLADRLRG